MSIQKTLEELKSHPSSGVGKRLEGWRDGVPVEGTHLPPLPDSETQASDFSSLLSILPQFIPILQDSVLLLPGACSVGFLSPCLYSKVELDTPFCFLSSLSTPPIWFVWVFKAPIKHEHRASRLWVYCHGIYPSHITLSLSLRAGTMFLC